MQVCCSFKNNDSGILLLKWFLILEAVVTKIKTKQKATNKINKPQVIGFAVQHIRRYFPYFPLLKGLFPFLILFSLISVAHYILHDDMGTSFLPYSTAGFAAKGPVTMLFSAMIATFTVWPPPLLVLSMSLLLFPLILYPHSRQNDFKDKISSFSTPPSKSFTGFPAFPTVPYGVHTPLRWPRNPCRIWTFPTSSYLFHASLLLPSLCPSNLILSLLELFLFYSLSTYIPPLPPTLIPSSGYLLLISLLL